MHDFTYHTYYQCNSTEGFSTEVKGSNGNAYTVRYGSSGHKEHDYSHGYSCTCPSYKFDKKATCKHIEQVKKEGRHCNWMQFTDGNTPTIEPDGTQVCPECGNGITAREWAC
ncbi:MAG TPA: hypothetical protein EYN67_00745 [Flavobacteriales bacterium]|nr:hypothetical protein [Flavobacteriales bacterium]